MDRKKVLLIFGGAWLSAAILTWLLWAATKAPKSEKTTQVVAATRDLPAGTRLKRSDIKRIKVIDRDLPKSIITDERFALDHAVLLPVTANEPLTSGKLSSLAGAEGLPAMIEPGKRAISVPITDASGVAGLVQPRAHVDVLFTRTGTMAEAVTKTILEDVVVLSIGRNTEASAANVDPRAARPQTQAATLLVTPEQARKLELAKNEGKISLALRNPLDRTEAADNHPTTAADLDLSGYARRRGPGVDVRDPKAWGQLTDQAAPPKKESPKPHYVVDVYRGDKHVQEIFQ
jgi:pilus assembly protein CpaB